MPIMLLMVSCCGRNKDAELKYRSASVAWEGENLYLLFLPVPFYLEFKER